MTFAEKLRLAHTLAKKAGARQSSNGAVWPDTPCGTGVTTGYIPHPDSEEALELIEEAEPCIERSFEQHISTFSQS